MTWNGINYNAEQGWGQEMTLEERIKLLIQKGKE